MENNSIREDDIPRLETVLLILSKKQLNDLAAKFRFADEVTNLAVDKETVDIYIEYVSQGMLATQIFKHGE